MASRTEQAESFARNHPYVAFGVLLVPVTYGITGDPGTALFTGGIVAFGPAIADGLNEATSDDEEPTSESGDSDE